MGRTGRPHRIPYDKRTAMPERSDTDPAFDLLSSYLATGSEDELTPTEARMVSLISGGLDHIAAFRQALPQDVVARMNDSAVKMGAVHATRRVRVLAAIAAETQRRILLFLPKALEIQHDLALNAQSEAVRERASRNIAAWCGLVAQVGDQADRASASPAVRVVVNTAPQQADGPQDVVDSTAETVAAEPKQV